MSHGHAGLGESTPRSVFYSEGRFGRLFPTLPPFAADTPLIRDALAELGAKGGPMDAGDDLSDPITLITDPAKSANNPDNPAMTAGFTFLGQFVDHDMTFDPTSSLARRQDPEAIRNFRIPALDLDNVYGGGPGASPHLYDATVDGGRTTLLVEEIPGSAAVSVDGSTRFDLPRNSQRTALLGDPRNDENLIVSQFHLALLRFHNRVVADVKAELGGGYTAGEIFAEAQRVVRWHYQWLVLHEFLEKTVGSELAQKVRSQGPKHFKWRNDPYIPVEFSVAAYRFGHSQVRPSYRGNFGTSATDITQQFFALLVDPTAADPNDPGDLRGGRRAPRRFIDWQTFFDFGDNRWRRNKRIDTTLSSVLFELMGQPQGEPVSLATRNLLRGLTMKLPSGQRVAKAMRLPVLAPADLADIADLDLAGPHAAVVLHPARGARRRRRGAPGAGRRADRRRGARRAGRGRPPVLPAPGPRLDADLRQRRDVHRGGPAAGGGRRGDAALTPGAAGGIVRRVRVVRLAAVALLAWCAGCGAAPDPQPPARDADAPRAAEPARPERPRRPAAAGTAAEAGRRRAALDRRRSALARHALAADARGGRVALPGRLLRAAAGRPLRNRRAHLRRPAAGVRDGPARPDPPRLRARRGGAGPRRRSPVRPQRPRAAALSRGRRADRRLRRR